MPLTLWRALEALAAAEVLPGQFGAECLKMYHAVKPAEFGDFMEEISAREYRWYL